MKNPFVAFIMLTMNLRLGQWLPIPGDEGQGPLSQWLWWRKKAASRKLPSWRLCWQLFCEMTRQWKNQPPARRGVGFVTDGGHHENLGLGLLLRRECRLIIVSDVGQDGSFQYEDLSHIFRYARSRGIRIRHWSDSGVGEPLSNMSLLTPDKETGLSKTHFIACQVAYPSGKEGVLVYIKPTLRGDEELDILRYRAEHPEFPHTPTRSQVYDEVKMEAYRHLGFTIGMRLCEGLPGDLWDRTYTTEELIQSWRSQFASSEP